MRKGDGERERGSEAEGEEEREKGGGCHARNLPHVKFYLVF